MPPARKARTTSNGPGLKGTQKTLPFNNNTRISKPSSTAHHQAKDAVVKALSSHTSTPPSTKDLDLGHIDSRAAVEHQAQVELANFKKGSSEGRQKTEEEVRARKVSDAQIKRYWKEKEAERLASRVHQGDLSVEEKVLRLFDMSSQYGPCIGIARMKRWVRANKLKLSPPIEVLAVLLKEEDRGNSAIERAHVDELMSSKMVEV